VSLPVQALPSSQEAVLFVYTHPVDGSQLSSVQGLLSLHTIAVPAQAPPAQVSLAVQALPSSQDAVLFVYTHPVAGLHVSSVHGLLSLQTTGDPGLHTPPPHVSPKVQAFPSLHGFVLFV
jgi:hypothetical protein